MKIRTLALVSLAIVLAACSALAEGSWEHVRGNGTVRLESREAAAFDGIENASSGLVRCTSGAVRQLTIEADANILPYIRTEVRGGILVLSVQAGVSILPSRLVFRITAPELRSVTVAGSGDIRLESPIAGDRLDVDIAGSGDIGGDIAVDEVSVAIRGSGSVKLAGSATSGRFEIYGSGDIEVAGLAVQDARALIRGSGSVTLTASRGLDVDIAGSGDVRFHGGAKLTVRDAGSGDLVEY